MISSCRALICIPTYNEADNLPALVSEIVKRVPPETDLLVIDDGSPDGTAELTKKLQGTFPQLHLLQRDKKEGLAAAYLAGFKWALASAKNYDWVFEMDADFSHNPAHLPAFFKVFHEGKFDAVLGSRYVPGGGISNWSKRRLMLSRGGSIYTRAILRHPLADWTGGFNAWSTRLLRSIDLEGVRSKGYAFQIELKYRSLCRGFKLVEIPIVFEERRAGVSKMSGSIVREAIGGVLTLKIREHS